PLRARQWTAPMKRSASAEAFGSSSCPARTRIVGPPHLWSSRARATRRAETLEYRGAAANKLIVERRADVSASDALEAQQAADRLGVPPLRHGAPSHSPLALITSRFGRAPPHCSK